MKETKKAIHLTSWYQVTTAPNRAIVNPIFINSPIKKLIGFAPPGFRTLIARRKAKNAFGIAQQRPPNNADIPEEVPDTSKASSVTINAVANCNRTKRAMLFPLQNDCRLISLIAPIRVPHMPINWVETSDYQNPGIIRGCPYQRQTFAMLHRTNPPIFLRKFTLASNLN